MKSSRIPALLCLFSLCALTGCATLLAAATGGSSEPNRELSEKEKNKLREWGGQELVDDAKFFNSLQVDRRASRQDPDRLASACFVRYVDARVALELGLREFEALQKDPTIEDANRIDTNEDPNLMKADQTFDTCQRICTSASEAGFERAELTNKYAQQCGEIDSEAKGYKHLFVAHRHMAYMDLEDSVFGLYDQHRRLERDEAYEKALENLGEENEDMAAFSERYNAFLDNYGDLLADVKAFKEREDVEKNSKDQAIYREQRAFAKNHMVGTDMNANGERQVERAEKALKRLRAEYSAMAEEAGLYSRFEKLRAEK